jgi:hypothetical protein
MNKGLLIKLLGIMAAAKAAAVIVSACTPKKANKMKELPHWKRSLRH